MHSVNETFRVNLPHYRPGSAERLPDTTEEVEVRVKLSAVAVRLARRALKSKRKSSKVMGGLVEVRHVRTVSDS